MVIRTPIRKDPRADSQNVVTPGVCEIESFIGSQILDLTYRRSFTTPRFLDLRRYTHGCAPLGLP